MRKTLLGIVPLVSLLGGSACRESSHEAPAPSSSAVKPATHEARPAALAKEPTPSGSTNGSTSGPPNEIDRLLAQLDAPCHESCADLRAGTLFELASLLTTRDQSLATAERLSRLSHALRDAVVPDGGIEAQRVSAAALAGIGALAAMSEPGREALLSAQIFERLDRVLHSGPAPRLRGRALLAIGALFPSLPASSSSSSSSGRERDAARRSLSAGLHDADRFVLRQAVIGATLARDEALDTALLDALRAQLGLPHGAPLSAIPPALSAGMEVELLPLLPAFVDLLRSLDQQAASEAAERLVDAVLRKDPRAATAHFLRAQLLGTRHDPRAAAELRSALDLGSLPEVFVGSLRSEERALSSHVDLAAARAEVRRRISQRPADLYANQRPRVTTALLDVQNTAERVAVRSVSPRDLEQQAEALLARGGAGTPEAKQLGERLFSTYPFGSQEYYDPCLRSFLSRGGSNRDLLDKLGLSYEGLSPEEGGSAAEGGRQLVGVVATQEGQGTATRYGVTCALCHSQVDAGGHRWDGLPARSYDPGLLLAACVEQPIHHKAQNRNIAQLLEYMPGRNDSSSDGVHNPTDIPSLYGLSVPGPVRWTADTPTLEVQIDRNLSDRSAPKAVITLVAAYLRGLALPPPERGQGAEWARGKAAFEHRCSRCHQPPAYTTGAVVEVGLLGTDRARASAVLPNSTEGYKIPSLLRLRRTAPYLHDGSVETLDDLLDPARSGGHRFGLDLPAADRAALVSFLRSL